MTMEKLLHERIAAFAAENPSKTALLDTQGEISYGQLEATSASLACELAATGVRQGDAVAVYVPYGKDILVGAVSALRAGGIYIPFDEAYPEERLETMLQESEAKAILTVRKLWNSKPLDFPEERVIFMSEELRVKSEEFATAIPSPDPTGTPEGNSSLFTLNSSLIKMTRSSGKFRGLRLQSSRTVRIAAASESCSMLSKRSTG